MIGGDCGWRGTGFYRFVEPHEIANLEANVRFQREFGVEVEILEPDVLQDRLPEFDHHGVGAVLFEPGAGTACNAKATASLLKHVCAEGGELRAYCRAMGIETAKGAVRTVHTDKGTIHAPLVVLAAGAASRELAATVGVDLPLGNQDHIRGRDRDTDNLRIPGSYMDPMTNSWLAPREQCSAIITAPHGRTGKKADPQRSMPSSQAIVPKAGWPR